MSSSKLSNEKKSFFHPKDSICIVTGAASGIGKSLCLCLEKMDAKYIIAVDLNLSNMKKSFSSSSKTNNNKIHFMEADVSIESNIRRIITKTEYEYGPIDAFFCNAGILGSIYGGGPEVSNDEWMKMWNVNVMQSIYVARHLFPLYQKRKNVGGTLMITASAAGLLTLAGNLPYSVTKHAAVAVAEWLRMSYADENIRVTCLCPQGVNTNMLSGSVVDPTKVWGSGGSELMSPEDVAQITIDAMRQGKFMVLPHKEVHTYFKFKAKDYDLWLDKMKNIHRANLKAIALQNRSKL